MKHTVRLCAALIASAALLFSQLAISGYACPMDAPESAAMAGDCDEAPVNANLCEQHCDYGSASFDSAKTPHVTPVALAAWLKVAIPERSESHVRVSPLSVTHGPAPPPLSRFTVLRI